MGDCARCNKAPAVQQIEQQLLRPIPAKPEFGLPEVWSIYIYVCQACLKPDDVLTEDEPEGRNAQTRERCSVEHPIPVVIMSFFNTQMICMDCSEKEKTHPDYPRAREAEREAMGRGDYNFPGIGKPEDL